MPNAWVSCVQSRYNRVGVAYKAAKTSVIAQDQSIVGL